MTAVDHAESLAQALRAVLLGCGLAKRLNPVENDGALKPANDEPSVLAAIRALQRYEWSQ